MKGLLLKDLYILKSYFKNILLTLVLYLVIIIANKDTNILIALLMSMLISSMTALATFSYDEKNKSTNYFLTLSVTSKDIVLEKYILSVLSICFGHHNLIQHLKNPY